MNINSMIKKRLFCFISAIVALLSVLGLFSCESGEVKPGNTAETINSSLSEYRIIAELSKETNNIAASYVAVKLSSLSADVNFEALSCRRVE